MNLPTTAFLGTMLVPALSAAASEPGSSATQTPRHPNIIVILADDLGYGDVSAYGSTTISTPNIDRLALGGIRFTNGYATSATSTPSRYALMTGLYPWRNRDAQILPGDAPLIVPTEGFTLPRMMQENGYVTGAIGKWHLGMGRGAIDWNTTIRPGAREIGFDYSCIIAATNDRVPTVYVENGNVVGLDPEDPIEVSYRHNFEGEPTALTHPELLKMQWSHGHNNSIVNGIPRIGFMRGGTRARWVDEEMADYFVERVETFIAAHSDEPFFLYYGLHEPHVPRAPHSRFVGTTGMGPRGDAIAEADWCVGELLRCLEEHDLLENTLIVFSSDNGPVLDDGYRDGAAELVGSHSPTGGLRGGKYSLFDAGTHVPLFVYWKGTVHPATSDALVSLLDLPASLGALIGAALPEGLDSRDLLATLLGRSDRGRDELVLEASQRLAIRRGDWVLIPPYRGAARNITGNELGNLPTYGLFNLKEDPRQLENRASEDPDRVAELERALRLTAGDFYHPALPQ